MLQYKDRLQAAMHYAGASIQTLADQLGISYQAVRKATLSLSSAFSTENNAKVAEFLRVNPVWLAIGKGSMLKEKQSIEFAETPSKKSLSAYLPCSNRNSEIALFVRAARSISKQTQDEFADSYNCTKGNVSAWENGRHEPPYATLADISMRTKMPLPRAIVPVKESQLIGIEGKANTEPYPNMPERLYPLICPVQAGNWMKIQETFSHSDAQQCLLSTKNLGQNGYMLRVKDKSMYAPGEKYSFDEGMLLHVNPDLEPVAGQFVIVRRSGSNEGTFKRYILIDGQKYLESINPDWPKESKYLKLMPDDVWCGVVVDASVNDLP